MFLINQTNFGHIIVVTGLTVTLEDGFINLFSYSESKIIGHIWAYSRTIVKTIRPFISENKSHFNKSHFNKSPLI